MAIGPVFNLIFGTDGGPSNKDVIDDVDKQAAEIKAKINEVMVEVQTLSENANKYHSEEMRQLQAIDSNISTMEFRKQTDRIAEDYANVLKRINQNKSNFTCDGMGKLNNTTYKAYKEIINDPMCNISTLQADFDAMLSFLKGERSANNHENGYAQLTSYLLDRVVAADKNEHSYTKTPDYHQVIKGINNEITSMEEHAILEIELASEGEQPTLPPFLFVVCEVTADGRFKNASLAKNAAERANLPCQICKKEL